ncbi:hypothetical protein Salat_0032700 [Sesamum alatum]|uniref:Uncharacterized protein n=1 Tax=Sesamum alatum TaxID=300844 RepID=A0AAE1YVW7_9LAMI|nr:hypothetical protein Salat_0032700 [Sesamum alatum]
MIERNEMDSKPRNPALSPIIWRFSPNPNGSNLLDSYELQAVTRQLNRAIRASHGLPTSSASPSPFYLHCLNKIYRENAKTSRKISTSGSNNDDVATGTRGFAVRLWKRIKRRLMRGNQEQS